MDGIVNEDKMSKNFYTGGEIILKALSDQDVDDELFAKLQYEFSEPAAIVELTAIVAFENFRSKFNHALQVEANGICQVKLSL